MRAREYRNLYREKPAAACAVLNGYGKSVGVMQIEELGTIETPILITSTLNVPRVADALISAMLAEDEKIGLEETITQRVVHGRDDARPGRSHHALAADPRSADDSAASWRGRSKRARVV